MPILSEEILQNPHSYQHNNFVYAKVMDKLIMDLQELPVDPLVEEGLPLTCTNLVWCKDHDTIQTIDPRFGISPCSHGPKA